jgi:hypothetical protein
MPSWRALLGIISWAYNGNQSRFTDSAEPVLPGLHIGVVTH